MNEATVVQRTRWVWWVAVVLLGVGLTIDIMDGHPLKLATSAFLFAGSLLSALLPLPRPPLATWAIFVCFVAGVALVIYRAAIGGL